MCSLHTDKKIKSTIIEKQKMRLSLVHRQKSRIIGRISFERFLPLFKSSRMDIWVDRLQKMNLSIDFLKGMNRAFIRRFVIFSNVPNAAFERWTAMLILCLRYDFFRNILSSINLAKVSIKRADSFDTPRAQSLHCEWNDLIIFFLQFFVFVQF